MASNLPTLMMTSIHPETLQRVSPTQKEVQLRERPETVRKEVILTNTHPVPFQKCSLKDILLLTDIYWKVTF